MVKNEGSLLRHGMEYYSSAKLNDDIDDDDNDDNSSQQSFPFIFDLDDDTRPEIVHVILFNPNTEREGVHTLEFPKGSGNNIILAFACKQECQHFSQSLRDQNFFDPIPQEVQLEPLEQYCEQIGVNVQVVPKGARIKPPKDTVLNLGLNPNLHEEMRMLDYLFHLSSDDNGIDIDDDQRYADGGDGAWE